MEKTFTITDWVPLTKTDDIKAEVLFHTWNNEKKRGHAFRIPNSPHPIWAISHILIEAGYDEVSYQEFIDMGGQT